MQAYRFAVEIATKNGEWYRPVGLRFVRRSFAQGACVGMGQFYPCPERRVVDTETGEVTDTYTPHGEVKNATHTP